jgi:hypothetical protein
MDQDYVGKSPIRKLKAPLVLQVLLELQTLLELQEPSLPGDPLQVQAYLLDALGVLGAVGEGYLHLV